jgi:putative DNA primase/helicase
LPHSPDKFFQYILDINFDKNAKCEKFMEFLKRSTNGEEKLIMLISEMMGYIIYGGKPRFEKVFFIIGPSGSGKSTLLDVVKSLIGSENYSSVPFNNLDRPFSAVQLYGKLANIVSELDHSAPISSMILKTIASGEEIQASYKGVDEFAFRPFAKLLMSCNQNPNINAKDGSVERRLAFINFPNEIDSEDMDTSIRYAAFNNEVSGILNFALEGAKRLYENMNFTMPDSHYDLLDNYKFETDSVIQWADEYLKIKVEGGESFASKKLYAMYRSDMKEDVKNLVSAVNFGRRFSRWFSENKGVKNHADPVVSDADSQEVHHHTTEPRRVASGLKYDNLIYSGKTFGHGFV